MRNSFVHLFTGSSNCRTRKPPSGQPFQFSSSCRFSLQNLSKQPPHPLQKRPNISTLIQPIHARRHSLPLQPRLRKYDFIPAPLRDLQLKHPFPLPSVVGPFLPPSFLVPTITINLRGAGLKHKNNPNHILPPTALNPAPQILLPKRQFRPIQPALSLHLLRIVLLRRPLRINLSLRRRDRGSQSGARSCFFLLRGREASDSGVHFGLLGGFARDELHVRGEGGGEGGDARCGAAAVFCRLRWYQFCHFVLWVSRIREVHA